jgi:hypothetical protein
VGFRPYAPPGWYDSSFLFPKAQRQKNKKTQPTAAVSFFPNAGGYNFTFFFFFFRSFAKISYVRFVPVGDHFGNTLLFHDWKKVHRLVSPSISPFSGGKRLNLFFLPFFPFFRSITILWFPVVFGIPLSMDLPPLPAAAALFPRTVIQAFLPLQLPIATCLSPDGSVGEGGGEGDRSVVAMARAVELQWIGGGAVSGLAVDWWWRGRGCWR